MQNINNELKKEDIYLCYARLLTLIFAIYFNSMIFLSLLETCQLELFICNESVHISCEFLVISEKSIF